MPPILVAMETPNQSLISSTEPSETSEVETLLSSIHLDRYVEIFVKAGLLSASDLLFLDQDSLLSLGVTATGHRKRILRLIGHLQRSAPSPRANQSPPSLFASMLDSTRPGLKPVPKPRTVFNRRRTTPVHFSPASHDPQRPIRRLSPESLSLDADNLPGNSKNVTSRSNAPDDEAPPSDRLTNHRSRSMSDASAFVPPVPPRIRRSFTPFPSSPVREDPPPAAFQKHAKSRSLSDVLPPIPPRLGRKASNAKKKQEEATPDSDWTEGSDTMEMVSNEIYWGSTLSGRGYSQQAPPTPPRLPTERSRERNR